MASFAYSLRRRSKNLLALVFTLKLFNLGMSLQIFSKQNSESNAQLHKSDLVAQPYESAFQEGILMENCLSIEVLCRQDYYALYL